MDLNGPEWTLMDLNGPHGHYMDLELDNFQNYEFRFITKSYVSGNFWEFFKCLFLRLKQDFNVQA